jgi:hypothetical protein
MTKLQKAMKKFDAQAEQAEDRAGYWQAISLLLAIWSSGGIPAAGYDPRVNRDLDPFFQAFKRLGADFRTAVDARAFPI